MNQIFSTHLSELVSTKTVFTNDSEIESGIEYCAKQFKRYLPQWKITKDKSGNLLVINPKLNTSKEIIYLIAHIDTVDAKSDNWIETDDPFKAKITETNIIGRGVNDCKAGVAYQIYLAHLISIGNFDCSNISFLVSRKEEGNQLKTSTTYSENFDILIPLSSTKTYFISLENTVSIKEKDQIEIGIYNKEPSNFFISVSGTIPELRQQLYVLKKWKPVVIQPINYPINQKFSILNNIGGHIATLRNEDNRLHQIIVSGEYDNYALVSGDRKQTSVVQEKILIKDVNDNLTHFMILNLRDFVNAKKVRQTLNNQNIKYSEFFPFKYGEGHDISELFNSHTMDYLKLKKPFILLDNPGRSDSSAIANSIIKNSKLIPITVGPGLRSHYDGHILRKTHGPNEGFRLNLFGRIDNALQYLLDRLRTN